MLAPLYAFPDFYQFNFPPRIYIYKYFLTEVPDQSFKKYLLIRIYFCRLNRILIFTPNLKRRRPKDNHYLFVLSLSFSVLSSKFFIKLLHFQVQKIYSQCEKDYIIFALSTGSNVFWNIFTTGEWIFKFLRHYNS